MPFNNQLLGTNYLKYKNQEKKNTKKKNKLDKKRHFALV